MLVGSLDGGAELPGKIWFLIVDISNMTTDMKFCI